MFVVLCPGMLAGQGNINYKIVRATVPGVNIRCMAQDDKGFMWIGTQSALYRFDSRHTKSFSIDASQPARIGGSDIRAACTQGSGLWITSTQGGVDRINTDKLRADLSLSQERFPGLGNNTITSLVCKDSTLFIGTERGLFCYSLRDGLVSLLDAALPKDRSYVDRLCIVNGFLLVFLRDWGCACFDTHARKPASFLRMTAYPDTALRFFACIPNTATTCLLATNTGIARIGVTQSGMISLDPAPYGPLDGESHGEIHALAIDRKGQVWYSTSNYLYCITQGNQRFFRVANALGTTDRFLNNIFSIYCDSDDNIWLGATSGLYLLHNLPPPMVTYYRSGSGCSVLSHAYYIFPVSDTVLLVTAESGLYEVNLNSRAIDALDESCPYDIVFRDPYGRMIVSRKNGLWEKKKQSFTTIGKVYPEFMPFAGYQLNSVVRLNDHELVMGTENNKGVLLWDFKWHKIRTIDSASRGMFLDNNVVNSVFKIRDDVFCVLTESSLIYMDNRKNTCRRIHLKRTEKGAEYGLFFDMCRVRNRYFISCYNYGILELDTLFNITRLWSTADSMSNNNVYKLLPWKDSLLFITTNYGLDVLNIQSGTFKNYYKSDGLNDNVFEETSGTIANNVIYAGGLNGFTAVYPGNIRPNLKPPVLYLDNFSIQFNPGRFDSTGLHMDQIVVPHQATQVTIYFSAINYTSPERTRFYYKFNGQDKSWIPLEHDYITLPDFNPGTHHIQVMAVNEDHVRSTVMELVLIFEPKWYQTRLFKLLVVLIILAGIRSLYRYRLRQLRKKHEIRKTMAADLHDDLGSSLTGIKMLADRALGSDSPRIHILALKDNITQATVALRDMIWVLDDALDTVDDLVARLRNFATPLFRADGTVLIINMDYETGQHKLGKEEKRNLFLICKEALHNCLKYARAADVVIEISLSRKKPAIVISDNGVGFSLEGGTNGYGLENMRHRARQVGYNLSIRTGPGEGTVIDIRPL